MNLGAQRVIHEVTTPLSMPLAALDLPKLREVFADLFDRVQEGVLAAGLDADDVILQRFVKLQSVDGVEHTVAVEWLSDRDRLIADLTECRMANQECRMGYDPEAARLTAAIVRAVTESPQ